MRSLTLHWLVRSQSHLGDCYFITIIEVSCELSRCVFLLRMVVDCGASSVVGGKQRHSIDLLVKRERETAPNNPLAYDRNRESEAPVSKQAIRSDSRMLCNVPTFPFRASVGNPCKFRPRASGQSCDRNYAQWLAILTKSSEATGSRKSPYHKRVAQSQKCRCLLLSLPFLSHILCYIMSNVNGTMTMIPPPEGYVVDFANPARRLTTETYTVFIVENIIAIIFLGQRLYTKIRLMKQFQIDDGTGSNEWRLGEMLIQTSLCHSCLDALSRDPSFVANGLLVGSYRCTCLGDFDRALWLLFTSKPSSLHRLE